MKKYQVWTEGYLVSGMEGIPARAIFHGEIDAESFDEACIKLIGDSLDKEPNGEYRRRGGNFCIWACRCFDNEIDARKSFG